VVVLLLQELPFFLSFLRRCARKIMRNPNSQKMSP
jgi:hypothetical protein